MKIGRTRRAVPPRSAHHDRVHYVTSVIEAFAALTDADLSPSRGGYEHAFQLQLYQSHA